MDLDNLRVRLANLGVDVAGPSGSKHTSATHKKERSRHALLDSDSSGQDDVLDVLERCHRVEASINVEPSTSAPFDKKQGRSKRIPEKSDVKPRSGRGKVIRFSQGIRHSPHVLKTNHRLAARCKNIHTPLGSVLAQYKDAEEHWAAEKAALRREAFGQRKRAHKLDLENKKLMAQNHHKGLDIKALKNALNNRDQQLQALQKKASELEQGIAESNETSAQQLMELSSERDELKSLLNATLKRLEAVDEFVYRTAASSSVMEERLKAIEEERLRALHAASKSRGLEKELNGTKKQLIIQKEMLKKMSEIQLKKNRKQQKAIRDVLESSGTHRDAMALAASLSEDNNEDDEINDDFNDPKFPYNLKNGDIPPSIKSILG